MTIFQLIELYVNKKGTVRFYSDGQVIDFEITTKDVKHGFGQVFLLVVPKCGKGEAWVRGDKVKLDGVKGPIVMKPQAKAPKQSKVYPRVDDTPSVAVAAPNDEKKDKVA